MVLNPSDYWQVLRKGKHESKHDVVLGVKGVDFGINCCFMYILTDYNQRFPSKYHMIGMTYIGILDFTYRSYQYDYLNVCFMFFCLYLISECSNSACSFSGSVIFVMAYKLLWESWSWLLLLKLKTILSKSLIYYNSDSCSSFIISGSGSLTVRP